MLHFEVNPSLPGNPSVQEQPLTSIHSQRSVAYRHQPSDLSLCLDRETDTPAVSALDELLGPSFSSSGSASPTPTASPGSASDATTAHHHDSDTLHSPTTVSSISISDSPSSHFFSKKNFTDPSDPGEWPNFASPVRRMSQALPSKPTASSRLLSITSTADLDQDEYHRQFMRSRAASIPNALQLDHGQKPSSVQLQELEATSLGNAPSPVPEEVTTDDVPALALPTYAVPIAAAPVSPSPSRGWPVTGSNGTGGAFASPSPAAFRSQSYHHQRSLSVTATSLPFRPSSNTATQFAVPATPRNSVSYHQTDDSATRDVVEKMMSSIEQDYLNPPEDDSLTLSPQDVQLKFERARSKSISNNLSRTKSLGLPVGGYMGGSPGLHPVPTATTPTLPPLGSSLASLSDMESVWDSPKPQCHTRAGTGTSSGSIGRSMAPPSPFGGPQPGATLGAGVPTLGMATAGNMSTSHTTRLMMGAPGGMGTDSSLASANPLNSYVLDSSATTSQHGYLQPQQPILQHHRSFGGMIGGGNHSGTGPLGLGVASTNSGQFGAGTDEGLFPSPAPQNISSHWRRYSFAPDAMPASIRRESWVPQATVSSGPALGTSPLTVSQFGAGGDNGGVTLGGGTNDFHKFSPFAGTSPFGSSTNPSAGDAGTGTVFRDTHRSPLVNPISLGLPEPPAGNMLPHLLHRRHSVAVPTMQPGGNPPNSQGLMRHAKQQQQQHPLASSFSNTMTANSASLRTPSKVSFAPLIEDMNRQLNLSDSVVSGTPVMRTTTLPTHLPSKSGPGGNGHSSRSSPGVNGIPVSQLPANCRLYTLLFKAGRSEVYFVPEELDFNLTTGTMVICEGDRGKDLGEVGQDDITFEELHQAERLVYNQAISALRKQMEAEIDAIRNSNPKLYRVYRAMHVSYTSVNSKEIMIKRIYSVANGEELAKIPAQRQDEKRALETCQAKAADRMLPMRILDAEFQWDREKLIFTYQTDRRVDFRDLVRDLYKTFKTRIWLKEEYHNHSHR
ncbi:hypothetical protein IWQ62_003107 [Dispira parvispora]|uniref:PSP1 C-terminal domain-containing protein n=1 Tax=Dispira parvispora TaxID=1520584 RepID=A0A9W8ANK5_9FUNG|nr:hypothetical protein IWQ62_003107 [Dispira parvispora]